MIMEINMQNHKVSVLSQAAPLWLSNFVTLYQKLTTENLHLLADIYHPQVVFIDPIHQVEGLDNLSHYFENLYQNLSACSFQIEQVINDDVQAAVYWQMVYQHPKLNKGQPVTVFGNSHIQGKEDKVIYHRDYLDVGAMLYEQLPVFGKLTKWLKKRAAK